MKIDQYDYTRNILDRIRHFGVLEPYSCRSGYTFRNILRAVISVSEGRNVLYVSKRNNMRDYYFRLAADVVSMLGGVEFWQINKTNNKINAGNGNFLMFTTEQSIKDLRLMGINFHEVYEDN